MRHSIVLLLSILASTAPALATACNWNTGEREQRAYLAQGADPVASWATVEGEIHAVALRNGMSLGVRIEAPEADRLVDAAQRLRHVPEMVKVSLFDMAGATPELLVSSYAGANSIQTYAAGGGAAVVKQLGDPGITLTLLKAVCTDPAAIP